MLGIIDQTHGPLLPEKFPSRKAKGHQIKTMLKKNLLKGQKTKSANAGTAILRCDGLKCNKLRGCVDDLD